MSPHREQPGRTSASRGAMSSDAGLLRIRALTKGAAVTAALGSVAIGLVLSHPAQSQAATGPGQSTGGSNTQAAPGPVAAPAPPSAQAPNNPQSQLAAPPQPPAAVAPQAPPPAAVSGGS